MELRARSLLVVVSTLLSLVAAEVLFRLTASPRWLFPVDPPKEALMVEHPQFGYGLRPGKVEERWSRGSWTIRVEVNEDGLRDEPLAQAEAASLRVIAVGDSFTFGIGVEQQETWPEVLERLLARRTGRTTGVVNTGVPGYSARQMRLRALDLLDEVDPALVVAGLYARSYWRVREPYTVFGGALVMSAHLSVLDTTSSGDLVFTSFSPGPLRAMDVWLKGHLWLPARVFEPIARRLWPQSVLREEHPDRAQWTEADYRPVLDELEQLRAALDVRGVPLVLLVVHHQESSGAFSAEEHRYNEHLVRFCEETGLPLANPLPRMVQEAQGRAVFRTPADIHWTPAAHELAAGTVLETIASEGLLHRGARDWKGSAASTLR